MGYKMMLCVVITTIFLISPVILIHEHSRTLMECFAPVINETLQIMEIGYILKTEITFASIWNICRYYFMANKCVNERVNKKHGMAVVEYVYLYRDIVINKGIVRMCDKPNMLQAYARHNKCIRKHRNVIGDCMDGVVDRLTKASTRKPKSIDNIISEEYCAIIQNVSKCVYMGIAEPCGEGAGRVMMYLSQDYFPSKAVDVCVSNQSQLAINISRTSVAASAASLIVGLMAVIVGLLMILVSTIMV